MHGNKQSIGFIVALATLAVASFFTAAQASAQTETVLHDFRRAFGDLPFSGVVFDKAGNLYGTTDDGGQYTTGVVYKLSPATGGGWTYTVIHEFNDNVTTDGYESYSTPIFDSAGNLYGTTLFGGANGDGTVFELQPGSSGKWKETLLYSFNGTTGVFANTSLIFDAAGNLYGATGWGGSTFASGACELTSSLKGCGTVFQLKRNAQGVWQETVLHNFHWHTSDGYEPNSGLVMDAAGNLYGTTEFGGTYNYGVVYELTRVSGKWQEVILHSFDLNGTDGAYPDRLAFDAAGNLYGTTGGGGSGANATGTVFKLTPGTGGIWTETVLYNFHDNGTDGYDPTGLIFDGSGNIVGTTIGGGAFSHGTVYKLSPGTGGTWTESILYSFGKTPDGYGPNAGVIFDNAGNMYGTTINGGSYGGPLCDNINCGTVFELTP